MISLTLIYIITTTTTTITTISATIATATNTTITTATTTITSKGIYSIEQGVLSTRDQRIVFQAILHVPVQLLANFCGEEASGRYLQICYLSPFLVCQMRICFLESIVDNTG